MQINEKKITKSRYNDKRILTKISDNEYILEGKSHYCRGGTLNEGQKFFDMDGGPMLAVGDKISFLDVEDERRVVDFEGLDSGDDSYVKIKITVG
jgi:hypothetical protein